MIVPAQQFDLATMVPAPERVWSHDLAVTVSNAQVEVVRMLRAAVPPPRRPILDWAEAEVIVPNGEYGNLRFRRGRHPATSLLLEEIFEGKWPRFAFTGPVQDGKTLALVLLALYYACELKRDVVFGAPTETMNKEKWVKDLLPVFNASPNLRARLPRSGGGSKGSYSELIDLRDGGGYRFMTAGGGDGSRSGSTAEVALVTEADKMDVASESSDETDPVSQIEARTDSYKRSGRARTGMECTSSLPEGRITQEIKNGSDSCPMLKCVHCAGYVKIERHHLVGWRDAADEKAARAGARLVCPACGVLWEEGDRRQAIRDAVMCHRGQTVEADGTVTGPVPETETLGYRWCAADSLLKDMGDVAVKEWQHAREADPEKKEAMAKELAQFVWAQPYRDEAAERDKLVPSRVLQRTSGDVLWARGRVPRNTVHLVAGADVGAHLVHWLVMAVLDDGRKHIVDYGMQEVASTVMETDAAIEVALMELQAKFEAGFELADADVVRPEDQDADAAPAVMVPKLVFIDGGYETDAVCRFIAATGELSQYLMSMGRGTVASKQGRYVPPKYNEEGELITKDVIWVGQSHHLIHRHHDEYPVNQLVFDADYHKHQLHQALRIDLALPGALSLPYVDKAVEHTALVKQILAEQLGRKFVPGRGYVTKMIATKASNHLGDAGTLANQAADICLSNDAEEAGQREEQEQREHEENRVQAPRNLKDRHAPVSIGDRYENELDGDSPYANLALQTK